MKMRRFYNRIFAVLFAVVMMVTSMPQMDLPVLAAQDNTGISSVDKADGDASFHEDSEELEGIIMGSGDDPADGEEYVTYTFRPGEHVRIYNAEGTEALSELKVLKGSTEELEVRIQVDEGYVIKKVWDINKTGLRIIRRANQDYKNALYGIRPGKSKLNPELRHLTDTTIEVTATAIAEYTVGFSYEPEQADVSVEKAEGGIWTKVDLIENEAEKKAEFHISNEYSISFEVRWKEGFTVSRVEYTEGADPEIIELEPDEYYPEEGRAVYSFGRTLSDANIRIITGVKAAITWNKPSYLTLGKAVLRDDEVIEPDESPYEIVYDSEFGRTTYVAKGDTLYFYTTFDGSTGESVECVGDWYLTTTGDETGKLESVGRGIDGERFYSITPESDMVITGIVPQYRISLVCDADVTVEQVDFLRQVDYEYNNTVSTFAENKKSIGIYHEDDAELTISGTAGKAYSVYTVVREWDEIENEQGEYVSIYKDVRYPQGTVKLEQAADGEGAVGKYVLTVDGSVVAIGITAGSVEDADCKLNFEVSNASVYVSVDGTTAEKLTTDEMMVAKGAKVRFRVEPWEGYRVLNVWKTAHTAEVLEPYVDGSGLLWYEVTAEENETFRIVTEEILTGPTTEVFVCYDSLALAGITAKAGGKEIQPFHKEVDSNQMCTDSYMVPVGATLNLTTVVDERYTLRRVLVGNTSQKPSGNSWTGDIAVEDSVTVTVETVGETYAVLALVRDDSEDVLPSAKMYDLYPGKTYSVRLYCGKRAAQLDTLNVNTKMMTAEIDPRDNTRALVQIMEGVKSGLKASLKLSGTVVAETAGQISATVQCRVTRPVESVTCKGPDVCTIDTRNVFTVTADPAKAGTMGIGAEVAMEPGMAEELLNVSFQGGADSGKLFVEVGAKAPVGQKLATVKLYRTSAAPGDADYYIAGGSIDITAGEPAALKSFAPEVSLVNSDDVSLTLGIKGADDIRSCIEGSQYYRIVVTPKAAEGAEIPASIRAATEKPVYVLREMPEDEEESEKTPAFVQNAKIVVNNAPSGKGQKWDYNVEVTLVQTGDKTPLTFEREDSQILYRSFQSQTREFATKEPSFSVKVAVKKLSSTIYTTQKNLVAANLTYDSSAACIGAVASDITDCAENEKLSVSVVDGKLYVSAFSETLLGKHTIEITPVGPETMYQKPANFVITVAKGIETLGIHVSTQRIYRQAGKAASIKTALIYNAGDVTAKVKKVNWSIVDADGMSLDAENPMYGKVNVKNGTISVAKTLNAEEGEDYEFCVKAQAADFVGNSVSVISPIITITATPMQDFGRLVVVCRDDERDIYDVVAKDGAAVTSDKLERGELVALDRDAEVKDSYTFAELQSGMIDPSLFSVKSSSPKALEVRNDDGVLAIEVHKIAKNVKLTVMAKDGSKKSASLKLSVQYAQPDRLAFGIYAKDATLNNPAMGNQTGLSFKGTVNTVVTLQLMEQTGSAAWKNVLGYTNHSVKVKGGKILFSDGKLGQYGVLVTTDKATVTLTDKDHKVSTSYVIANTGYSANKAPKIKVKPGTAAKLKAGALTGRAMTYEIGSGYDGVLVEADKVSEQRNSKAYYALEAACGQMGKAAVVKNGAFELTFDESSIPVGSYKLSFTPMKSVAGGYEAASKPVNITLKVEKPKVTKGSYKLQTSYTLKAAAGEQAALSGKGTNLKSVTFDELLGMNVKGKENGFLQYFELKDGKLMLKAGLTAEQIAALKANKNDQKGYVTYTAAYGDNGYGVPMTVRRTVMITVKLK